MHRKRIHRLSYVCLLVLCLPLVSEAAVKLPALFADNLVLQREHENPIWGWADAGETVEVRIAGKSATTTTAADGKWRLKLPKLGIHREPLKLKITGSSGSVVTLKNILVGDVWFCTGPSNIFWPVKKCDNAKQEIAAANYPEIRFFTLKKTTADEPQDDCVGNWFECSPETVGEVSGVGYFCSRRIHKETNVPIGVLQSFWGGSRVESWTSREALAAEPGLKPIFQWWEKAFREYDAKKAAAAYKKAVSQWRKRVAQAKKNGKKLPARPRPPANPHTSQHRPASLYNGMVAPLIPYGIKGILCYQGLGNLYWAEYSRVLMPTMVRDWRARWGQGDLPIGMVQPAPYPCGKWAKQNPDAYSLQRESQLLLLDDHPNLGIAFTMDIGDLNELHPTNKQDVGWRMASWALATVYKQEMPWAGPVYRSMSVEGSDIRIRFKHTAKGLKTNDGRAPSHFVIAGKDKKFYPADAVIDGHTVLVRSKQVLHPTAVRFAWSDVAVPNLFNTDELPASIFRTDVPPLD